MTKHDQPNNGQQKPTCVRFRANSLGYPVVAANQVDLRAKLREENSTIDRR